jgi:carotenoid cleavage dioxygenase
MNRREFFKKTTIVAAGAAAISSPLNVFGKSKLAMTQKELFDAAYKSNPALIGLKNISSDYALNNLTIEGKIPKDFKGTMYRIGPAKHERAGLRYNHLFEGDGMLHGFKFADGKVTHQGKFIRTPKYKTEEAAGRFLYSGPDTRITGGLGVSSVDAINTSNTNVVPVGDDLWTLWEAGSAMRVNPDTLKSDDFINLGAGTSYGDQLKGLPFSAHPKIDPSGDIWNFGLSFNGQLCLYHLNPTGKLKNFSMIKTNFQAMLHDFLITHKSILIILPSISMNGAGKGFFEKQKYEPNQPMKVMVIDKATLKLKKTYEVPAGFVFHFGNAWEEENGTIHFDASLYPDLAVLKNLSLIMEGGEIERSGMADITLYKLNPNGSYEMNKISTGGEFPRVYNSVVGLKNKYIYCLGNNAKTLWTDCIRRINTQTGKIDEYDYGSDFQVEEHVPIANGPEEGSGYVVGTALHVKSKRTCINIFKASDLSSGPLMRAWLPYHIPLGFHGNFKKA